MGAEPGYSRVAANCANNYTMPHSVFESVILIMRKYLNRNKKKYSTHDRNNKREINETKIVIVPLITPYFKTAIKNVEKQAGH